MNKEYYYKKKNIERKRDLKIQSEGRQDIRKGKEVEKRGKNKGRRRELEKINLKCKIYDLMCINVFSLALILCFVED